MQIFLHTDPNTDGTHAMSEHLESVIRGALSHALDHVTRVEAHLSDVNGLERSGPGDVHCTLEARLIGLAPVVVKDQAGNAHQAIDGAAHKLKRAVGSALEKQAAHHPRSKPDPLMDAGTDDA